MKQTTQKVTLVKLVADEGKLFRRVSDQEVLGPALWLGREDSAENYEEVDAPEAEGGTEPEGGAA